MADGGVTPEQAATEILRRRRARNSLVEFSQSITIPGAPVSEDADEWLFKPIESSVALHQRVMMQQIQECIETEYGRLMIFAPPGSAKSSYAAVVAPAWAMGKIPGLRVLATSYASTPIIRASKRARQICASDEYRNIWTAPTTIVKGSNASDEWELTNGSGFFCAGLLGGITSSRCFPAGTPVTTPTGDRPIESLAVGDEVLSFDLERNCYTVRKLIATRAKHHEGDLVEVVTTNGSRFRSTPEHRVYTAEHGYREASILEPGNTILRRESSKQPAGKPDHALPTVPWDAPCETDTISVVRRVSDGPVTVYDLQVEATECFFAGSILVHNCDLGIIDDPVAGRMEAESERNRKTTIDAYRDDFLTRLKPKASIVLIQTRWHQDDLAGSILPEDYAGESGYIECRDGQTWRVLCIPAEADRVDDPLGRTLGDYLWPEWFSSRHWQIFKKVARTWASLFQQKPVPDDGIYFKRSDIKRHRAGESPEGMAYYLSSDFATKGDAGDYTCHGLMGIDGHGKLWLDDGYSDQKETDVTVAEAIKLIKRWKPLMWLGEKGPIESSIGPQIRKSMRRAVNGWAARHMLASIRNKVQRAQGIIAEVSMGNLSIVEGEWGDRVVEIMISFPGGRTDDEVDMLSLFGRALDVMRDGKQDAPEREKPTKLFTRRHIEGLDREDQREQEARDKYYT